MTLDDLALGDCTCELEDPGVICGPCINELQAIAAAAVVGVTFMALAIQRFAAPCPHGRTFCEPGNRCLGCSFGKQRRDDDG
jgi:hypothetical protein